MKKIPIWSLTILMLTLTAAGWFVYKSQVKQEVLPPNPPGHFGPPEHKQWKIKGIVTEYGSNPDGDIDKLLLTSGNEKIWLHFPPHAARSVKAAAPIQSIIEVTVGQGGPAVHHRPDPAFELKHLENQAGKASVDLTEITAPPPRKGFEVEIEGNVAKDLKIGQGPDNSFILSGKLISVPPHMAHELFPFLSQAKTIRVKGYLRDSTDGFLSASGMPVVKAGSIQLDGVTYKIR